MAGRRCSPSPPAAVQRTVQPKEVMRSVAKKKAAKKKKK
jgi:hypothetical protein